MRAILALSLAMLIVAPVLGQTTQQGGFNELTIFGQGQGGTSPINVQTPPNLPPGSG